MNLRAQRLSRGYTAANLHRLHGLQRHDRLRQNPIQPLIPIGIGPDACRRAVNHYLEDAANRVAGAQGEVHFGLHALLRFVIHAIQQDFFFVAQRADLFPGSIALQLGAANTDHVARDFDAQLQQQRFRHALRRPPAPSIRAPKPAPAHTARRESRI